MKRLTAALFTLWIATQTLADIRLAVADERTADTLKQLERDWLEAERARDGDKLGQIVADDFIVVDNEGSKLTKEQLIARVKSGAVKAQFIELGPMEVKLLGDVAVVHGSDVEKGATNGKHTGGEIIWMDVFAKRDGKWVAVRSQSARAQCASGN
jgi:ketosteroid isomerase-like protein